ncbi:unnamed protein product [Brassica oleracea]|uniref:(rape) hypothetical protein n=1 Tax=Brassica napus TaxID=3708 RepID=A0A816UXW4_BRANA|nr:unnamed protein product [Brassica napus]
MRNFAMHLLLFLLLHSPVCFARLFPVSFPFSRSKSHQMRFFHPHLYPSVAPAPSPEEMPPKQQPKADLAKKQKQVEDKTFGLKNKNKSKNVQKYVQSLKQSVQPKPDASKVAAKKKKEEEKAREQELNELFKVAISQPKVPVGVDPKSILCEFFKAGQCQKGFKCKFSHDLNIQRKGEKIDIYSDKRDEDGDMEEWDQETLEKVVESKKNEYNQNKPTDIVCKYFLDAVEKKQYGWFWACPNGGKECHYRHALPPGYILKSQMKALLEEESQKMPVEEEIESERAKLKTATQMTPALFMEWKRKKIAERDAGLAASQAERAKNDRMSVTRLMDRDVGTIPNYSGEESSGRESERFGKEIYIMDFKRSGEGVLAVASTTYSLNELVEFLESPTVKIPVGALDLGTITPVEIWKAFEMSDRKRYFSTILAFDVDVTPEAIQLAEQLQVKVICGGMLERLHYQFKEHIEELGEDPKMEDEAIFPGILSILPNAVFSKEDPIVLGVLVVEGFIKVNYSYLQASFTLVNSNHLFGFQVGVPISYVRTAGCLDLGRIAWIEKHRQPVDVASLGDTVIIKIVASNPEEKRQALSFGSHYDTSDDILVTRISRGSLFALRDHHKDKLSFSDMKVLSDLKRVLNIK